MKDDKKPLALIVDDGPGITELLGARLAREGFDTVSVTDADAAEKEFGRTCPDLILVDYSLPGRSGLQLIEKLREAVLLKNGENLPPFIVITGHGDERIAVEMMKLGAADYLVKDPEFLSKIGPAAARVLRESRTRRLLRESESRFRTLFECGNDAIFVHPFGKDGVPGKFTEVNDIACARLGYTREELLDMGPADVDAVGMDDKRREALERLASAGHAIFSMVHKKKNGDRVPVEISASRFDSAGGTFVVSICRDMTERLNSEKALRASESRFRAFFQDLPMGVAIYRPMNDGADFEIADFSPEAERIEGVKKEELLGRKVTECFPGVKELGLLKLFSETAADGKPRTLTSSYYRDDRKKGWRENTVFRLPDGLIAAVYRDTTAEESAKLDVEEKEEKYRSLLESLPDIVMNFDRECRHTFVSSNVAEIGMEPELFLDKTHAELGFPPELCRFLEEKLLSVFDSGKPVETEFEADLPAGRRAFSWRLFPQINETGGVSSVTTLARDITEYRALQADYKQLFDSMLDGFALHEMIFDERGKAVDYRFVSINPAFEKQTGLKAGTALGRKISELMPGHHEEWVEAYAPVVATGKAARFERFSESLGKYYDILAFRPRPGHFACIFKDITEQKSAETKLRELASMLEMAGRMARFGGWSVDLATNRCHWSDEVDAIHGEPPGFSPPVEKGISYYAPEYRDRITKVFEACARGGVPYDEEMEIITPKGDRRWVRTIGQAERDASGGIIRVSGSFQDITARKKEEETLRESEERFRSLFENHSAVKLIVDPDTGTIEDANPAAAKFYGWPREKLIGMKISDINTLPPEKIKEKMNEAGRGENVRFEFRHRRADGSVRDVEVFSSRFGFKGRERLHSIVHDITERKRMEEDLLKSQKIESLGILAGGIAHDFNNILTGITANLSLLLSRTGRQGDEGEALNEALAAANTAKGLTRQLLAFAEGGKPVKRELDAGRAISEAARLALRGTPCSLELKIAPDLWSIEADETQLSQVIVNLCSNAAQAMPGGGSLAISAANLEREGSPFIEVSLSDTGTGIPEKYLADIFDPYFTTKKQGHGLGLAMAYSIVKGHGGEIKAESKSGQGSTFTVSLPATGRRPAAAAAPASAPASGSGRILVMDDEEVVLKACRRMITSLGYECVLAEDGVGALAAYEKAAEEGKPFDAVIMDLTIQGGMGGKEAVAALRKKHPEAKVIASSGYAAGTPVSEYAAMGFDGLLAKPYNYEEIAALLKKFTAGEK